MGKDDTEIDNRDDNDLDPSDSDEGTEEAPPPSRSRRAATAQEFLESELGARAERAQPKLRSTLVGTIKVELSDTGEKFLLDWSGDKPSVSKVNASSGSSAATAADCSIRLSSNHFMKIAQGDLNPQIGMLSDKIQVVGKLGLAIYFFNLVAPIR